MPRRDPYEDEDGPDDRDEDPDELDQDQDDDEDDDVLAEDAPRRVPMWLLIAVGLALLCVILWIVSGRS
jgi:hypothetical protein